MSSAAPRSRRSTLDRSRVVETARQIALREGMAAVTMSGVARSLGVTPMALYRHVGDIDQLVELVIDAIHAEITLPETADTDRSLGQYVFVLRSVYGHYGKYRGLAEVLLAGGAATTSGGERIAEWFLHQYEGFGLDSRRATVAYATFREFFLVSLIQRRQPGARQPHAEIDDVTAEQRFDFAVEMFLRWAEDHNLSAV